MKFRYLMALLLIVAAGPPVGEALFGRVLRDPDHHRLVLEAAQATPAWRHSACAAASFSPAPDIAVFSGVTFDKQGTPMAGAWLESVIAKGCGAPLRLNVLTKVAAPAKLETGFLLPGDTIADPVLQDAGQGYAVSAAGGVPAGCVDPYIANTAFGGYDGPDPSNSGSWHELWTLDLCGPPQRVVMHFAVSGSGATISAQPVAAQMTKP